MFRKAFVHRTYYWFLLSMLMIFSASKLSAQIVKRGAQSYIKIDSITRLPDNPIPFDQPFSIVLTLRNPQNITDVIAIPLAKQKGKPYYKTGSDEIKVEKFRTVGSQLVLEFKSIKPNTSFDLYLERRLDGANLDTMLDFAAVVARSKLMPNPYNQADMLRKDGAYYYFYNSLVPDLSWTSQISRDPAYSLVLATFKFDYLFVSRCNTQNPAPCPKCRTCNDRALEMHVPAPIPTDVNDIINEHVAEPGYANGNSLLADLKTISQIYLANKLNDQVISSLIRIETSGNHNTWLQGLVSSDFGIGASPLKTEQIAEKGKNFQTSAQSLSIFTDTVTRLANEIRNPDAAFSRVIVYLGSLATAFKTSGETVKNKLAEITKTLDDEGAISYPEYYVNNNDGFKDLQTASGSFLSPQVGLSFLGMSRNFGSYQVIPKITLGVNINFKPINKNLRRTDIPDKDWRNYVSGFFGITFGGFSNPEYNNLLASNSLLAGLNLRINRALYFSMGGSAFKQQNKNPVINSFHPEFGAYASLLIDIDVTSAASSVVSYFTK